MSELCTVAGMPVRPRGQSRFLATVVVTDIVDSTVRAAALGDEAWRKLLDRHDAMVRTRLRRFGGLEIKMIGDGVLATFDTPVEALSFAMDVRARAKDLGLEIRVGVHTGECEARGADIGGMAVHIASRVAAVARPSEVVVSSTVKDLATGAPIVFTARPSPKLKGVSDQWALFTADAEAARSRRAAKTLSEALPRVVLVDDHPLWRETLRGVLRHRRVAEVVGEAGDGAEALLLAGTLKPDIVVMDIDLPAMNGIAATRRILEVSPETRVLMLSSSDERAQVLEAVQAGAAGYLLKTAGSNEISDGVRRVHGGELVFPPKLANMVLGAVRATAAPEPSPLKVALRARTALDRRGLTRVIQEAGFDVVVVVGSIADLVRGAADHGPEVLAVEIAARDIEALGDLRAAFPDTPVLLLTGDAEPAPFVKLLADAGGVGLVLKESITDESELADMIRRVARGDTVLDPAVARQLLAGPADRPLDVLTERELEVLALMAEGRSNQAICERVHVSAKTVEGYVSSIFSKLGLETTPDDHRRVLAVVAYLRNR